MIQTKTLYQNTLTTPLGRIQLAGFLNKDQIRLFENRRVFGSYAIVYLLEGTDGIYYDANRYRQRVTAGDLLILFPDLAHSYGPQKGDMWRELFIVFDGPVFDFWREAGFLDSGSPVRHLEPIGVWTERFETLLTGATMPSEAAARVVDVARFVALLTEALAEPLSNAPPQNTLSWLPSACNKLESYLTNPLEPATVAAELGLSYETFRKRFQEAVGVAPAQYRTQKRIEAAISLLQHTQLTNKEIAESLGFSDPYHFGKRFKLSTGMTPKQFRRNAGRLADKPTSTSQQA